jgi:hypothetical protein
MVEESTIRKIKSEETYRIPVETLFKICEARKLLYTPLYRIMILYVVKQLRKR